MSVGAVRGSVALGLAVWALLTMTVVGWRVTPASLFGGAGADGPPACVQAVEWLDQHGPLVVCLGDPRLAPCGLVRDGDRVELRAEHCMVTRAGMSAPMRLARGLPLDLNLVTAADLERIEGVGPAVAAAIVSYRASHGPFQTVDDLEHVRGIGPTMVARLRRLATVIRSVDTPGVRR